LRDYSADSIFFRKENRKTFNAFFDKLLKFCRRDFRVRFDNDFACFSIYNIVQSKRTFKFLLRNFDSFDAELFEFL